jgi:hypothetical protein
MGVAGDVQWNLERFQNSSLQTSFLELRRLQPGHHRLFSSRRSQNRPAGTSMHYGLAFILRKQWQRSPRQGGGGSLHLTCPFSFSVSQIRRGLKATLRGMCAWKYTWSAGRPCSERCFNMVSTKSRMANVRSSFFFKTRSVSRNELPSGSCRNHSSSLPCMDSVVHFSTRKTEVDDFFAISSAMISEDGYNLFFVCCRNFKLWRACVGTVTLNRLLLSNETHASLDTFTQWSCVPCDTFIQFQKCPIRYKYPMD